MKIINILPDPRHYSYASRTSNGRTLKPGESSPDLPLSFLHLDLLQKDLKAGKIHITFSAEDRAFLLAMLKLADQPAKVKVKPAAVVVKPVKAARHAEPAPKPQTRPTGPVEPAFAAATPAPKPAETPATGPVSLRDLAKQNRAGVPDFPQVGANKGKIVSAGTPVFDAGKSSLRDIQRHLGGMV